MKSLPSHNNSFFLHPTFFFWNDIFWNKDNFNWTEPTSYFFDWKKVSKTTVISLSHAKRWPLSVTIRIHAHLEGKKSQNHKRKKRNISQWFNLVGARTCGLHINGALFYRKHQKFIPCFSSLYTQSSRTAIWILRKILLFQRWLRVCCIGIVVSARNIEKQLEEVEFIKKNVDCT